jgi:hypothetical protein
MGTKLPGSRPSRSAANNARNADFLGSGPPMDQGGFGTEDMQHTAAHLSMANVRPSELCDVPDLMALGDAAETFGGA